MTSAALKNAALKSTALLMLGLLTASCPAMAKSHHGHSGRHYAYGRHTEARAVHHANLARHAKLVRHASLAHHADVTGTHESHSGITCEMVRAYVAQVGLAQAAAMAQSAGITAAEKDRARRCLEQKS